MRGWEPRIFCSQPQSLTRAPVPPAEVTSWYSKPLTCYSGFLFSENFGDAKHGRSHHSHHALWPGSSATHGGTAQGPTSQGREEALKRSPTGRAETLHRAQRPRWDTGPARAWPLTASRAMPWGLSFSVHLILSTFCR